MRFLGCFCRLDRKKDDSKQEIVPKCRTPEIEKSKLSDKNAQQNTVICSKKECERLENYNTDRYSHCDETKTTDQNNNKTRLVRTCSDHVDLYFRTKTFNQKLKPYYSYPSLPTFKRLKSVKKIEKIKAQYNEIQNEKDYINKVDGKQKVKEVVVKMGKMKCEVERLVSGTGEKGSEVGGQEVRVEGELSRGSDDTLDGTEGSTSTLQKIKESKVHKQKHKRKKKKNKILKKPNEKAILSDLRNIESVSDVERVAYEAFNKQIGSIKFNNSERKYKKSCYRPEIRHRILCDTTETDCVSSLYSLDTSSILRAELQMMEADFEEMVSFLFFFVRRITILQCLVWRLLT